MVPQPQAKKKADARDRNGVSDEEREDDYCGRSILFFFIEFIGRSDPCALSFSLYFVISVGSVRALSLYLCHAPFSLLSTG